jgi:hypothetical protein
LWDTGAQASVITKKLASELKLVSIGKARVYGSTGSDVRDKYLFNIFLPNKVGYPGRTVTECEKLAGGFEALIGMDIIASGDFALTNKDGHTMLTFQVPSTHELDFSAEISRQNDQRNRAGINLNTRRAYEANLRNSRKKRR